MLSVGVLWWYQWICRNINLYSLTRILPGMVECSISWKDIGTGNARYENKSWNHEWASWATGMANSAPDCSNTNKQKTGPSFQNSLVNLSTLEMKQRSLNSVSVLSSVNGDNTSQCTLGLNENI